MDQDGKIRESQRSHESKLGYWNGLIYLVGRDMKEGEPAELELNALRVRNEFASARNNAPAILAGNRVVRPGCWCAQA